jgi:hypothetical protein
MPKWYNQAADELCTFTEAGSMIIFLNIEEALLGEMTKVGLFK